jgi:ParB family chromosome partitioning protein
MAKKLFEKAGLIQLPAVKQAGTTAEGTEAGRPKTAPGSMVQFLATQSAAVRDAESLRERLAEFDGAAPARRLDPKSIRASKWANRHQASFEDAEFAELKADIASAGGNVQAIKVRPLPAQSRGVGPSNPPSAFAQEGYEIVFGHRRHRACLELGLPVLAVVEEVSDQQLFAEMDRENRDRKDLSAWEQGTMYARALDAGLYASNRQMAASIGRDLGDIGKALALVRLPQTVIGAFRSPLDLQYRWAKPLGDAQQRDPDALLARAKALKGKSEAMAPKQIFEALVGGGEGVGRSNPPAEIEIKRDRKRAAVVSADGQGRTVVRFEASLDDERRQALVKLIESFLAS